MQKYSCFYAYQQRILWTDPYGFFQLVWFAWQVRFEGGKTSAWNPKAKIYPPPLHSFNVPQQQFAIYDCKKVETGWSAGRFFSFSPHRGLFPSVTSCFSISELYLQFRSGSWESIPCLGHFPSSASIGSKRQQSGKRQKPEIMNQLVGSLPLH
jgi:hypothetical protein